MSDVSKEYVVSRINELCLRRHSTWFMRLFVWIPLTVQGSEEICDDIHYSLFPAHHPIVTGLFCGKGPATYAILFFSGALYQTFETHNSVSALIPFHHPYEKGQKKPHKKAPMIKDKRNPPQKPHISSKEPYTAAVRALTALYFLKRAVYIRIDVP